MKQWKVNAIATKGDGIGDAFAIWDQTRYGYWIDGSDALAPRPHTGEATLFETRDAAEGRAKQLNRPVR